MRYCVTCGRQLPPGTSEYEIHCLKHRYSLVNYYCVHCGTRILRSSIGHATITCKECKRDESPTKGRMRDPVTYDWTTIAGKKQYGHEWMLGGKH